MPGFFQGSIPILWPALPSSITFSPADGPCCGDRALAHREQNKNGLRFESGSSG